MRAAELAVGGDDARLGRHVGDVLLAVDRHRGAHLVFGAGTAEPNGLGIEHARAFFVEQTHQQFGRSDRWADHLQRLDRVQKQAGAVPVFRFGPAKDVGMGQQAAFAAALIGGDTPD